MNFILFLSIFWNKSTLAWALINLLSKEVQLCFRLNEYNPTIYNPVISGFEMLKHGIFGINEWFYPEIYQSTL